MEKLAEKLNEFMKLENLSLRAAAIKIGVSHSTIDRVLKGEMVEIDTLTKFSEFLKIPIDDLIGQSKEINKRFDRISNLFSIEPELAEVLDKMVKGIKSGDIDKKIITEVSAFTAFRIRHYTDPNSF